VKRAVGSLNLYERRVLLALSGGAQRDVGELVGIGAATIKSLLAKGLIELMPPRVYGRRDEHKITPAGIAVYKKLCADASAPPELLIDPSQEEVENSGVGG